METENKPKTKQCDNCDTVIAESEATCPACGHDSSTTDADIAHLERLEAIRKKRAEKNKKPEPKTDKTPQRKGLFGHLTKVAK